MKDCLIEIGRIVISKAGRDTGKTFIICDIIDENYVFLVDGNLRKLNNPKKKKIKHLDIKPVKIDSIRNKLLESKKVFDSEIYSAIENYLLTVTKEG